MDYSSITELDLSYKGLTQLPDLSLYTNLKNLNCSQNQITSMNNLPHTITDLDCADNPFTYDFIPTLENIRKHTQNTYIKIKN